MVNRIYILLLAVLLPFLSASQSQKDCFEIKYLDYFVGDTSDFSWPAEELDQLLMEDFASTEGEKNRKTNFLVPLIIFQLKNYHPLCAKKPDTLLYAKLVQLYSRIRQQDYAILAGLTVEAQLDFIRADYYKQIANDSLLPYLSFTLDDGPLYGEVPVVIPDYKKGNMYDVGFGKLFLLNKSGKISLTFENKDGKHVWTRLMTGVSKLPLSNLLFSKENVFSTPFGYVLQMSANGESLNLFLKSNGEFRYYFHSW